MLLNFLLISGGLAVIALIGHWTIHPLRNTDPYWI